jgi:tetratricopeptide (TPR) repeat protein
LRVDRDYTLREVVEILGLPRGVIAGFVAAGLVRPTRGRRREQRFAFADLVVLRSAKSLLAARVSPQRLSRTLRRLRERLPDVASPGVRLESVGGTLVVSDRRGRWRADSGQFVLAFDDTSEPAASPRALRSGPTGAKSGGEWMREAVELEGRHDDAACAAYRAAVDADPALFAAWVNLGRLLHELGRHAEARAAYEQGIASAGDDALLRFNLGVLLEDMALPDAAAEAYAVAVTLDPDFADAHYNLALLHAAAGRDRLAVRHFGAYRQSRGR